MKLSVVLAVKDEEVNIGACLDSVKDVADEIIVFDENSMDNTAKIAKKYGARVFEYVHKTNFHETKQKAIDEAKGEWILQLDADERVTKKLKDEIGLIIRSSNEEILEHIDKEKKRYPKLTKLFDRHQKLIEQREGSLGEKSAVVAALFIPRVNYFLGRPLVHAGVYPDGVIRLFKNGKAYLPTVSVHEVMKVKGRVEWLFGSLEHHDSPTLSRYFSRMNRYTDIRAQELQKNNVSKNLWQFVKFTFLIPITYFLKLYVRHLGFLDGYRGFMWSFLSAMHYPISYYKYWIFK